MTTPSPPPATQERSPDDLLTIPEAADLLKVSAVTISRWRRQGKLRAFKVGPRAVRIRRGDLLAVFDPQGTGGQPSPTGIATPQEPGATLELRSAEDAERQASRPSPSASVQGPLRSDVMAEAADLRAAILSRRGGIPLPDAVDDGHRIRDKRRKRK